MHLIRALLVLSLAFPTALSAQVPTALPAVFGGKHPGLAAAIEVVVPLGGHVYAEDLRPGVAPAILSAVSFAVFLSGMGDCVGEVLSTTLITMMGGPVQEVDDRGCRRANVALGVYGGSRLWGAVRAHRATSAWNDARRVMPLARIGAGATTIEVGFALVW